MPDLRQTRKKLKTALAIMAGVDLLAALVYFSPLVGSAESRRMQMNLLQADLTTKTRQVAPLKDLPQKLVLAGHQINDFYQRRFAVQQSQIVTEFDKLASGNGVPSSRFVTSPRKQARADCNRWKLKRILRATTLPWRSSSMRWSGTKCFSSSTA